MIVVIDCIEYYRKYCIDIPVESKVRLVSNELNLLGLISSC